MEKDKRFISVSSTDVRGPQKMPAATKARYMELAKQKRPAVEELLRLVDETSLLAVIERLQDYETRNSFSGANGNAPARSALRSQSPSPASSAAPNPHPPLSPRRRSGLESPLSFPAVP